MNMLITAFWKICLFQQAPQELPSSRFLMFCTMWAYLLVSAAVASLTLEVGPAILSALVDVCLVAGLTRLVLWARSFEARFVQTFTALMATGAMLGLIAFPVLWWQVQSESTVAAIPGLLMVMLWIWNLSVVGHILRHALSMHYIGGVMIALLYAYVSFNIIRVLFLTTG